MDSVHSLGLCDWDASTQGAGDLASLIEDGQVIYLPRLRFELQATETRFLSPNWLDGGSKSVYCKGKERQLRGTAATGPDRDALQAMVERFGRQASRLVHALFPEYVAHLKLANTSFRPSEAAGRQQSWRHDDTRLHTDAFPSQPLQGSRILRVFTNVHPAGKPRVWRIGEPFPQMADRFLPHVGRPVPGKHWLLEKVHFTKSRRTEYDHIMLRFHDLQKADLAYQRTCPQQHFAFPPGSTWICFSDQVLHAVMEGQFLFEQTFHLPASGQQCRERSPLGVLEKMTGRRLAA